MLNNQPDQRYADRPPRIQPVLPQETIPIPKPPEDDTRGFSARQLLLPLIMIGGYVLISFTGQGRNLLFMLPMGLSVIASSIFTYLSYRSDKLERTRRRTEYRQLLSEMRQEMVSAHDMQRDFYHYNYPDPETVMQIDGAHIDSRGGSRLWERRTFDTDFAAVRLGIGTRPSQVIYEIERGENEEDALMKEALRLADDSRVLRDVPLTIPLYYQPGDDGDLPPIRHAIGVSGDSTRVYPFVRSILNQIITLHAPSDINLHVVGVNRAAENWRWLHDGQQVVPHIALPKVKEDRRYFPICFEEPLHDRSHDPEKQNVPNFWKLLHTELDRRSLRLRDEERNRGNVSLPFLLVIVDLLEPVSPQQPAAWLADSALSDLEAEAAIAALLSEGQRLGAAVLFLVPERRKVPSGCNAVIEVENVHAAREQVDFRYAEIGVNTPRYVGQADTIENLIPFQEHIREVNRWSLRRSYGEGIPDSLSTLELFGVNEVESLHIAERWRQSRIATRPDPAQELEGAVWPYAPIGMMSNGQIRRLIFSADGDGVHGMIAGSTGSGKSELLMTLILSLAINFDPSVVNFVLIDYKGGAAFDPFKQLPHTVDIVTNLQGTAVDRMFKAINAELNRRQAINTATNSKHIVHYRERNLHRKDPADFERMFKRKKEPYPHLFIIIDEFAEMIAGNAEYKAQLNSITRLGRALGVSLILAAQRPTGVTDQMRANIKFRISLRVETREESSEMLRRPDAAYLPTGIPGRGYLQVGNENIELIQMGWSGGDYEGYSLGDEQPMELWEQADNDVIWLDRLHQERKEAPKLFEVMVDVMSRSARQQTEPQFKPWPSPLPSYLPLYAPVPENAEYLNPADHAYLREQSAQYPLDDGGPLRLSPAMYYWRQHYADEVAALDAGADSAETYLWRPVDWEDTAMRPVVGLVDDPAHARQGLLRLNFRRGHVAVFGGSGWGKTTLLRSAILSLAVTHSPEELHVYILDFGGRQLEAVDGLPHVGAIITADQEERLNRLLRKLDSELEYRKEMLSHAHANDLYSYNVLAETPLPAILVVVDNFAEIRENYEELLPSFMALAREGLMSGIHFVVSGEQTSALGKLYSLFSERLTLKLADSNEYSAIVGRIPGIEDIPGRGYIAVGRNPLQFQVALPVGVDDAHREAGKDETGVLAGFVENVSRAWNKVPDRRFDLRPPEIVNLSTYVMLDRLIEEDIPEDLAGKIHATLGLRDSDLDIERVPFQHPPHFVVAGLQQTGKTTALRSLILSIAYRCSPEQVGMVLVDPIGLLFRSRGNFTLADLPHVLHTASEPQELREILDHVEYEYKVLAPEDMLPRRLFIFIDNYDDIRELKVSPSDLSSFARSQYPRPEIHFVVAGSPIGMKTSDELIRRISRFGLAMDAYSAEQPFNARLSRSNREAELPMGRGFLILGGRGSIIQVATPQVIRGGQADNVSDEEDASMDEALDRWVSQIIDRHANRPTAAWLPMAEAPPGGNGNRPATQVTNPADIAQELAEAQLNSLRDFLAERLNLSPHFLKAQAPEALVTMAYSRDLLEEFLDANGK